MAIAIYLSGIDRTAQIAKESVNWSRRLNARGDARMRFHVVDTYRPDAGIPVSILEDGVECWGGMVANVEEVNTFDDAQTDVDLDLACTTWEAILDGRVIAAEVYTSQTAGFIVTDLHTKLLADDNITLGTISDGVTIARLNIDHRTAVSVLDELAQLCGFVWYIDPVRVLHFREPEVSTAPFTIESGDSHVTSLRVQRSILANYANEIIRKIAPAAFASLQEDFVMDGSVQVWDLTEYADTIESIEVDAIESRLVLVSVAAGHTVTIDGLTYTAHATATTPAARQFSIAGSDSDDAEELAALLNDGTYGVPDLEAIVTAGTILLRRVAGTTGLAVSSSGGTITNTTTPGFEPRTFGLDGVETGDDYYWNVGSSAIAQDISLHETGILRVRYRPFGASVITSVDAAEIAARAVIEVTSGRHTLVIDDADNIDAASAQATNDALLTIMKNVPTVVHAVTIDTLPRPGMVVTVDMTAPLVAGDFYIQEITAQSLDVDGGLFQYSYSASNKGRYGGSWQEWLKSLMGGGASGSSSSAGAIIVDENAQVTRDGSPVTY